VLGFKVVEFRLVAKREANVIKTIEQAVFAERIDLEVGAEALLVGDGLGFEIDRDLVLRIGGTTSKKCLDLFFGKPSEDDAILTGVGVEDVGEGGCDDGEEAVLIQRPRCMFAQPKFFSAIRICEPL